MPCFRCVCICNGLFFHISLILNYCMHGKHFTATPLSPASTNHSLQLSEEAHPLCRCSLCSCSNIWHPQLSGYTCNTFPFWAWFCNNCIFLSAGFKFIWSEPQLVLSWSQSGSNWTVARFGSSVKTCFGMLRISDGGSIYIFRFVWRGWNREDLRGRESKDSSSAPWRSFGEFQLVSSAAGSNAIIMLLEEKSYLKCWTFHSTRQNNKTNKQPKKKPRQLMCLSVSFQEIPCTSVFQSTSWLSISMFGRHIQFTN